MKRLMIAFLLLILAGTALAQESCPAQVENTLNTLGNTCDETARNELCYGNTSVSVVTMSGDELPFSEPGDVVSVVDIATISTSPFAEPDEWGIALMKVQANIPDSLPGQAVTFLLFGQVEVRSADTISADDAIDYAPMQAIYFQSGVGETACNEVPRDGILIQTPAYEGQIELVVNDVEIALGSTVYLQAEAGNVMSVYVVEGFATVKANEETVNLPAGTFTQVEINDTLNATGVPAPPQPYVVPDIAEAPTVLLDEPVPVAEPASEETITRANVGFVGSWVTTDADGSTFITNIFLDGAGYRSVSTDTATSIPACQETADSSATAPGTVTVNGNSLTISESWSCNNGRGEPIPFERTLTYDSSADTMSSPDGLTLQRR